MFFILYLKEITEENWREVANLSVTTDQKNYIETNKDSLLEAVFDKSLNWLPLALQDGEIIVGFAMVGAFDEKTKSIWLDRLMIDRKFQHQGYGKRFLKELVDYLQQNWIITQIFLSVHQENKKIFQFYEAAGFVNTHQVDPVNGEIIMVLTC
ncbi:GNAT family N-acetyltransferase [Enterococcus sp. HY326]|uniref:GNAT family N-acetyltransferase n=1 Tax=Enterococcus sp. HY326 TaxID=2971265 RepID=UPI00223F21AA|nr:GNAT family N-acetyltransferase [Enterococcus sp. HY326]